MNTPVEIYIKILKGELNRFPNRFWVDPGAEQNAKEVTIYFIEEVLKWNKDDIRKNLCEAIFRKNKLSGMLEYTFDRSPFKAINNAYPNTFKEWEFKAAPKHIWEDKSKREEAITWLLIKVNKDKFKELTNADFLTNGLGGLLDYFLKNKEFKHVDENKVEEGLSSIERILKVTFNKSGGTSSRNGVTTRLTLPTSWVKELGLTEKNREVIAKLEDGKIIIEPKK
ncbi:AbrB/MazE/SpoVT family DNA-binding domain-containing protein [Clostridium butyricum]|uniref:AbrB/MazE/SpoVT family DNA-binding domain-containing protein n=1 Tax=Clostridium butyricum TaxID=1492 RepID=UPI002012F878|nr:AbrB/MazE/SpoVT family DNA-binding domain-containing protein [Clostridium butyricum]